VGLSEATKDLLPTVFALVAVMVVLFNY
jgi:hypothetical protein